MLTQSQTMNLTNLLNFHSKLKDAWDKEADLGDITDLLSQFFYNTRNDGIEQSLRTLV